jgi:hypothetical protein
VAVTDPENRDLGGGQSRIDIGAIRFVDAGRTTGDDDPLAGSQLEARSVAWLNIGIDAKFPDPSRDEMGILAARIKDGDLW